jgi:hypothetical protein
MIWLVWRRQRAALMLAFGLIAAIAIAMVIGRYVELDHAKSLGVASCLGNGLAACEGPAWTGFVEELQSYWGLTRSFLLILPAIVGVTAGGGLFGREFDHGTHVFALTQSISRLRWWGTGVLVAGLPAAAGIGILSLLTTWAFEPFDGTLPLQALTPPVFETSGLVPVAYTVLAFTVAAAAGLLLKSTPGAIAAALLVELTAQFGLGLLARPSYARPSLATDTVAEAAGRLQDPALPTGSWQIASGFLDAAGQQLPLSIPACATAACLRSAGAAQSYILYHPVSQYWPFQLTETTIYAVLAAAALGLGLTVLRRRVP